MRVPRLAHRVVELGEREAGVAVDDRLVVGPAGGGAVDDTGDGLGELLSGLGLVSRSRTYNPAS